MNLTPTVSPWLWASVFAQTLAAGLSPLHVARQQRDARLAALLRAAHESPLYRQRLRHTRIGGLEELPALEPVDKAELMQRFDEWSTDRAVTRDAVERFLQGSQMADAFLGRYLVWTSSGTSGTPGIFVQDERCLAVYEALDAALARAGRPRRAAAGVGAGRRLAFVAATGGPFAGAVAHQFAATAPCTSAMTWLAPSLQSFSVQHRCRLARQRKRASPPC